MSASREKKKRQEFLASGGVDPKAARAAEQKAADKKAKTLYISLAVIFVAITVFMLVFNSGILQRGKTAVTIDGTDYSVVETSFYYNTSYQNLLQNMGGDANAAYFGLDTSKPLKDQTANTAMLGLDTEISWDKYFKDQAVNSMKFIHATLAKAEAEGLTLDEAELSALDTNIQAIKDQAAANGYSYKAYLSAVFGAGMTPAIYEQLVKDKNLDERGYFIYHAVGTQDSVKSQTLMQADEMLSRPDVFTSEHYMFFQKEGGYHDLDACCEFLYNGLPVIFGHLDAGK